MAELEQACLLFSKAALHNRRAARALVRIPLIFFRYGFIMLIFIIAVDPQKAKPESTRSLGFCSARSDI